MNHWSHPPATSRPPQSHDRGPKALLDFLHPGIRWVQLESAGIERYFAAEVIDGERVWTSAAGAYSDAEARFKKAAAQGNKEVASLAKMGLASVYQSINREQDAINIYNELVKNPTTSVSKERVQFALAALYETRDPAQAKKIYDQLSADKSPTVAQLAKQRQTGSKQ